MKKYIIVAGLMAVSQIEDIRAFLSDFDFVEIGDKRWLVACDMNEWELMAVLSKDGGSKAQLMVHALAAAPVSNMEGEFAEWVKRNFPCAMSA